MTVTNHSALCHFIFPCPKSYSPTRWSNSTVLPIPDLPYSPLILADLADIRGAEIRDLGVFKNNRGGSVLKSLKVDPDGTDSPPVPAGAWMRSIPSTGGGGSDTCSGGVVVYQHLPGVSECQSEIAELDFESTLSKAEDAWREKLGVVQVDGTGVSEGL